MTSLIATRPIATDRLQQTDCNNRLIATKDRLQQQTDYNNRLIATDQLQQTDCNRPIATKDRLVQVHCNKKPITTSSLQQKTNFNKILYATKWLELQTVKVGSFLVPS